MGCFSCPTTESEHKELHSGQCKDCGADVDVYGTCIEIDDCEYSPEECDTCGYCPCDESC